ncbi:ATP-binding protein [Pseudorhizobium marinum]|uniref:ATP-binding protein n=1 Tax=Pseudorhizobium marinum TaxID=1496690 RepID=UPI0004962561|nr:ATP-binding protein [Pseudorhizobium marinum]
MSRTRPALLLLIASLIPVIVLAAAVGRYFIQEQQRDLDNEVHERASVLAAALQRELDSQVKLLTVVAESPRLDPPISRRPFTEIVRRMRERIPEWEQVRISDKEGDVLLAVPPMKDGTARRVVDLPSHEIVVRDGAPVVGDIALGPGGNAAFAVRVPISREDRVRAVLSAVIRPTIVTDLLYGNGLPPSWAAWVLDGRGRLVTSTGAPALAGGEATAFATFSGSGFGLGRLNDGVELRVAEAALQGTPWRVRVGLPVSEYQALSRKASLLLAGASCFTLLLSGSAALLFLREARARNRERETIANWQRMDALGKLTGQAAHDFNNLLMVFQSGVDGISRRRHDEQRVTQLLTHMASGVARGKTITQRLLSFSRRSNQGAERIDLDVKLAETLPLLQQAANDSIVIVTDVAPETWSVHADPAALEIALINLATNAREAMTSGGELRISTRNVADGRAEDPELRGEFVAITVADTGTGIAADALRRVFEPFYSEKKGSAGLGLTQVHSFAKGSGGSVSAVSLPGRGSAFTILLPRSREERPGQDAVDAAANELPRSILIVDDTPSSLESVRLSLETLIPEIVSASDGSQALRLLRQRPDLEAVLSDIMMPGMSGIELAAHIAQTDRRLPVVLMTGYSDKLEGGSDLGRPVVAKPFKTEELADAFAKARGAVNSTNVIPLKAT